MTEFRTIDGERERQRVAGRRHLESVVAHCSDPAVSAPQSHGSGPSSNRFAPSSFSTTNPGGLPPLLHLGASGSYPMCSPLPSCWHPLPQLHHTDTSTSSSSVPWLCSVAYAFAGVLVHLLVLGSLLLICMLHGTSQQGKMERGSLIHVLQNWRQKAMYLCMFVLLHSR